MQAEELHMLRKFLLELEPIERHILSARFGLESGEARTLNDLATLYGGSRERIRQIEKTAIQKLRLNFKAQGVQKQRTSAYECGTIGFSHEKETISPVTATPQADLSNTNSPRMKKTSHLRITVENPVTIELSGTITAAIVADFVKRSAKSPFAIENDELKLSTDVAGHIVQKHLAACFEHATISPLEAKRKTRSRNNPKPRAERLTDAFAGNRTDFEITSVPITPQLQQVIEKVLAMPECERIKHYSGALRLRSYHHEIYRWFGTITKSVLGRPIRRFFRDLPSAVTWLEAVRERWENNKLMYNVPQGGVSRLEFRMPWESQGVRRWNEKVAAASRNGWTAESRAKFAATTKTKNGFHSVAQKKEQNARRCVTAAEILGAAYPMPGNNISTALRDGNTSAGTKADTDESTGS